MIFQQQRPTKINNLNLLNLKHIVQKQRNQLKQRIKNKKQPSHTQYTSPTSPTQHIQHTQQAQNGQIKTLTMEHDKNINNFNDNHKLRIQTSFRQRYQKRTYSNQSNISDSKQNVRNVKNIKNINKYKNRYRYLVKENNLGQISISKREQNENENENRNQNRNKRNINSTNSISLDRNIDKDRNKIKTRKYAQQLCQYTPMLNLVDQVQTHQNKYQSSSHANINIDTEIDTYLNLNNPINTNQRYPKLSTKLSHLSNRSQLSQHLSLSQQKSKRSKSSSSNIPLTRQQRITLYKQTRTRSHSRLNKPHNRYKNQKLNIIAQQHLNIIKRIPPYLIDQNKFQNDINNLVSIFTSLPSDQICLSRHASQNYRTFMGLMLFFIGYELYMRFTQDRQTQYQNYQLILANYNQIYYAMRLKAPLIILQCYLTLIDIAIQSKNYIHAQKYSQKCLMASIFYKQKYYEQRCIQKISMCEYYKGNICQATYLHDNNGQVTQDSLRQIRQSYNEQEQIDILFHHLYDLPRFQVEELLADYEERSENYKALVVFKSPRIGPEDSMKCKTDQIKVDIRTMERLKEFKKEAGVIRKEVKKHESLFTVRRGDKNNDEFKLVKRNLTINEDNQSSQVLRAHQSLNRVRKINMKPLKYKLTTQFVQFLNKIKTKLR